MGDGRGCGVRIGVVRLTYWHLLAFSSTFDCPWTLSWCAELHSALKDQRIVAIRDTSNIVNAQLQTVDLTM